MHAAAERWAGVDPCLFGRVHAANQCLASKAVYQMAFHPPTPTLTRAMQRAVNSLVSRTQRAEEATPFPHSLFPGEHIAFLPRRSGGLGLMDMEAQSLAMLAKKVWQLFVFNPHPAHHLLRHEISSCLLNLPPILPSHLPAHLPPGAHWCVTSPSTPLGRPCPTPCFQSSLDAFLQLRITRIQRPHEQSAESVFLEHTFGNTAPQSTPLSFSAVTTPMARSWLRLRAVHHAFIRRHLLPLPALLDLNLILQHLPPAWHDIITEAAGPHPASDWLALSHPDEERQVFSGPDNNYGLPHARVLWELFPSGRLHRLSGAFVPLNRPRPALVVERLWPRVHWLQRERDFAEAQRQLPPHQRRELTEPWLLGVYEDMDLDPTVWGLSFGPGDSVALSAMTVKAARRFFTRRNALRRNSHHRTRLPGYEQVGAVWPRAWALDPAAAASPVTATSDQLSLLGLVGLEEHWRRASLARSATAAQLDVAGQDGAIDDDDPLPLNVAPLWIDLQRALPPRPSRAQRLALRQGPPAPDLRQAYPRVWSALLDPSLPLPFVVTAWRILHGQIGCNAFLAHVRHQHGPAAYCTSGACHTAHTEETISHAFFTCPEVQPAVTWFVNLWDTLCPSHCPPPHGGGPPSG